MDMLFLIDKTRKNKGITVGVAKRQTEARTYGKPTLFCRLNAKAIKIGTNEKNNSNKKLILAIK